MALEKLRPFIFPGSFVAVAPGRINLIGEHTDYNQGFVLPAAIDKAVYTSITPRSGNRIHLHALDMNEWFHLRNDQLASSKKMRWTNYIVGVIAQFKNAGYKIPGLDLTFTGDLPIGGGLSSSAAVECSVATALNEMLKANIDKIDLALMCQKAEHTYAGVMCGIMDQFASLFGKKDHAIKLDCRSLEYEYLPFKLKGIKILLYNTNIKHSLATSEYNIRHQQCRNAANLLAKAYPDVKSLRDATLEMIDEVIKPANKILYQRSRFVVEENQRLLEGCDALKRNDIDTFGKKMFGSHQGLSQMYFVSCAELDFLVDQVKQFPEVIGARMMGGGFGGCTLNLIKQEAADDITAYLKKTYREVMKRELSVHDVRIADGSTSIDYFTSETKHVAQ
jgi:galactokinase